MGRTRNLQPNCETHHDVTLKNPEEANFGEDDELEIEKLECLTFHQDKREDLVLGATLDAVELQYKVAYKAFQFLHQHA